MRFTNCSFTGAPTGTQSAGFFLEQTSIITNATFENCQFTCRSTTDDTLEKRTAGFLMEDQGTTISNAGFTNCTFSGKNTALAWQRWQIQNGPADFPIVTNVLVKDCTMLSASDRGISLHYLEGSNAVFHNVAIQGSPAVGIYADVNGNGFKFINVSYDGGGAAQGAYLATSLNFESANWLMRGCSFTNLSGIGLHIRNALKTSTFENLTLTGAAGSSHGIFVDDSLATTPSSKHVSTLTIRNSIISGFGGDGVRVNGNSHTIRDCTITGAGGHGVNLLDESTLRPVASLVQCVSNTITDCAGTGVVVEGQTHTIGYNTLLRNGEGIRVRNGILRTAGQASNKSNTIIRNAIYGSSIPSGSGLWEARNPAITNDPGPNTNTYLNNTVTDWAVGTEFRGFSNRIQNNIFFFNTVTNFRVLPSGLSALRAGWNCAPRVSGNQFDGIAIDYSKDIWYNPGFSSRTPGDPDFYFLGPLSPCRDRGTTNGLVADGHTDLGCIESGASEVASWRRF
ncbi:right-handed parallel beta-helix repeat-containing protein [bacterium]|nr:right-handed parallel beta-helix repeat-containing protein [bacterium]